MAFYPINKEYIKQFVSPRIGEVKIGESIEVYETHWKDEIKKSQATYIIVGVVEDIGPQANLGRPGADEAWEAFLEVFLNMQTNDLITLESVAILGFFDFTSWKKEGDPLSQLRSKVEKMDKAITEVLEVVYKAGKIPILIGGGHNNAYPLMKAAYNTDETKKTGVVNLDPHADFRALEGRHSGNSFSTAMIQHEIYKYAVMGLHKAYNSQSMLEEMKQHRCEYHFFDDIVRGTSTLGMQFESIIDFFEDCDSVGIELDLDSIRYMPVSAFTPSGISIEDARSYVFQSRQVWGDRALYFHFTEGAPRYVENGKKIIGKTLAYLVHELIQKD